MDCNFASEPDRSAEGHRSAGTQSVENVQRSDLSEIWHEVRSCIGLALIDEGKPGQEDPHKEGADHC